MPKDADALREFSAKLYNAPVTPVRRLEERSLDGVVINSMELMRTGYYASLPLSVFSFGCVCLCDKLKTRGSAIAEEPRDALRQLKYYGRFLTELLTRSSANPEEPCEHTVS